MSLPHASKSQIDAMNAAAEKQFGADAHVEAMTTMHPMLQNHAEPEYSHTEPELLVADVSADVQTPENPVDDDDLPRVETNKEYNMRMLREGKLQVERERDELIRQLSYQQQAKVVAPLEPEEDYLSEIGLDDDSLVEGKHIKAYLKKQRELEKQLKEYKSQSSQETVEVRLKHQYPDFDNVVSTDNLNALRNADPDLADMIMKTPDLYKQASLAYRMVKQYGIHKTVDPKVELDKAVAIKNASKPRPMAAVSPQQGSSPLSQANAFANGMTKDLQASLLREMRAAQKGY